MYTKGEWYTEEDILEEVSILSIPDGDDFPDTIATVRLVGNCDGREMLANAQLIASAPDLYEALKSWDKLRAMHPLDSGADINYIFWECCEITDKALAKAEVK